MRKSILKCEKYKFEGRRRHFFKCENVSLCKNSIAAIYYKSTNSPCLIEHLSNLFVIVSFSANMKHYADMIISGSDSTLGKKQLIYFFLDVAPDFYLL